VGGVTFVILIVIACVIPLGGLMVAWHERRVHQSFVKGWRKGLKDSEAARKSWTDAGVPPDSDPWWIMHGPDVSDDER
jgi:hypothetical protein